MAPEPAGAPRGFTGCIGQPGDAVVGCHTKAGQSTPRLTVALVEGLAKLGFLNTAADCWSPIDCTMVRRLAPSTACHKAGWLNLNRFTTLYKSSACALSDSAAFALCSTSAAFW